MAKQIIVVEDIADWTFPELDYPVVHADDYLTGGDYFNARTTKVINLCRSTKYFSVGYYCSLLAEARGHRVIPSVKSMLDLSSKAMYGLDVSDLDDAVQKVFKKYRKDSFETVFEMDVYFGKCRFEAMADLARQIFETFPCPLLRANFRREGKRWHIESLRALSLHKLDSENHAFFAENLAGYLQKRWRAPRTPSQSLYDIAILYNADDPLPPSDEKAIQKFIRVAKSMDLYVDVIDKKDYSRLAEYDALFIRATTAINHFTYRFSKKAESEGMVVIDDPQSILRCTNKVYLAELLRAHKVPAPQTVIAGKNDLKAMEEIIGYPMVLKVPDGSFSRGVVKAENPQEMRTAAETLLKSSELILAQAFLYTEFDWRIGILDRKPLFACQYFMSAKHWQIVHHAADGSFEEGRWKTLPVEKAPREVVDIALKAANLIGDGLYGVDVKQGKDGVYVIEVNDNPNIDAGVEDQVLKDDLYRQVLAEFVRRLNARIPGRAD